VGERESMVGLFDVSGSTIEGAVRVEEVHSAVERGKRVRAKGTAHGSTGDHVGRVLEMQRRS
jgi:hypothetical protein